MWDNIKPEYNPNLQRALNRINAEIALEDELAELSEQMEIQDLISQGVARGGSYKDGFFSGLMFRIEKQFIRAESIHMKYRELERQHPEWFE